MPLSEVHQLATRKHETNHSRMTNSSTDLNFMPEDEFVELLWENGQIVVQGQSSTPRKNSSLTGFNSYTLKVHEKNGQDHAITKTGTSGNALESSSNDPSSSAVAQDDEMVTWFSSRIEDALHNDYSSEFWTDFAGINTNSISTQDSVVPIDLHSSDSQVKDSHLVSVHSSANLEQGNSSKFESGGSRPVRVNSVSNLRSQVSDSLINSCSAAQQAPCVNSNQSPLESDPVCALTLQKKDNRPLQPSKNSSIMNFSHFSRPAALVKASLQSIERLKNNGKVSKPITDRNQAESSLLESDAKILERDLSQPVSLPKGLDLKNNSDIPTQELLSAGHSEPNFEEDTSKKHNNRSPDQILSRSSSFGASVYAGRPRNAKGSEPVVASSSVCSGNSARTNSNDPKHRLKRKCHEIEESEYQSEDEDESVDARKQTGRGTSSKRGRAAEVHNLSERRRRDRINEKMRALQELIPNCNKVDKASMLDEAIEYLKTLQLQVQIMSMGTGLCMPPMILPAGMPPMHAPHMAHFSPMGAGMRMGMGVGLGMGFLDMNRPAGYPLIPVSPIPGAQFPGSSLSGPTSMHMMPGSSFPMFGMPGQGQTMSVPRSPLVPSSSFTTIAVSAPNASRASSAISVPDLQAPKDSIQTSNVNMVHKMAGDSLQILASIKTTKDCFGKSDLVLGNNQTSHVNENGSINTTGGNKISSNDTTERFLEGHDMSREP